MIRPYFLLEVLLFQLYLFNTTLNLENIKGIFNLVI